MSAHTSDRRLDLLAMLLLVVLWLLFFWRLFTPVAADQASLTQGDFSGQFVAFGAYQYARFSDGEVPLWNPYNNGGLPFIADTQAAVFYPPRLATIALSSISGTGWTYHALELEMAAHVLLYTLLMYAFVRRLTRESPQWASVFGGLAAAIIAGYGGYLSGYPPLQLGLLEAGIWLPLSALGILEGTRHPGRVRWPWFALTGAALGLSWMAGHPQTSWFLTYLLVAYAAYRTYAQRYSWRVFMLSMALFGSIGVGAVAVTLFPGAEYLLRTSRSEMGFDAKGGGFPYRDMLGLLVPGLLSQWSPLYVGITGLALALIAVWKQWVRAWFWAAVVIVALALSVGADGALFHALYNTLPGLSFFRGQERAAYLVANGLAILGGFGAVFLVTQADALVRGRLHAGLALLTLLLGVSAAVALLLWTAQREVFTPVLNTLTFSLLMSAAALILLPLLPRHKIGQVRVAVIALIVFELFSVGMNSSNYDPIPPDQQLARIRPPLIETLQADTAPPFRVDGLRGLRANYGSLYQVADIQGISPLFLSGVQEIIEFGLPDERAWELFAVRYVYSDWEALPVPWEKLGHGQDVDGPVSLFRLTAPRPYAHLLYEAVTVSDDESARHLLADPEFDPRQTAILHREPTLPLPEFVPDGAGTTIIDYAPETFTVIVNTPENAILSLAHVAYPGWHAEIDGKPTRIVRAYGGLMALEVPAGEHRVSLRYDPLSYRIGVLLSVLTWAGLGLFSLFMIVSRVRG